MVHLKTGQNDRSSITRDEGSRRRRALGVQKWDNARGHAHHPGPSPPPHPASPEPSPPPPPPSSLAAASVPAAAKPAAAVPATAEPAAAVTAAPIGAASGPTNNNRKSKGWLPRPSKRVPLIFQHPRGTCLCAEARSAPPGPKYFRSLLKGT